MQFTPAFWESLPPTILILVVLLVGVYNIVRLISKLIDNTIARMDRMIEAVAASSARVVAAVDTMEDRLSKKMDHATETVAALTTQCALAQSMRTNDDAQKSNSKPTAIDALHPRIGGSTNGSASK